MFTIKELRAFLEGIKDPQVDPDRQELIEDEVGDSVIEAYGCGYSDGYDVGRHRLAQKILEWMLKKEKEFPNGQ